MRWMVTQLYSDVASRPTRGRQEARLSVARRKSAGATVGWRGLGPRDQEKRTRRAPLGGYVRVDYSSSTAAGSHIVKYKIPRQVDSTALGTPLGRQTIGSQRGLGSLGPTRSVVHLMRLFAAPDHNSSWSRRLLESLHAQYI